MSRLETRVEKLEEATNPAPDPEEVRRNELLATAIEEARERVRTLDPDGDYSRWDEQAGADPAASPLPGARLDLAAAIRAGRDSAANRAANTNNN